MAIRFDAAADRLLRTANVIDYNTAYTFMCLVRIGVDPGASNYSAIFAINRNVDTADFDYVSIVNSGGLRFSLAVNIGGSVYRANSAGTSSTGVWYWVAMVREDDNSLVLYWNSIGGALVTEQAFLTISISGRTASSRHEIGGVTSSNARPLNLAAGRVYAAKLWTAALSTTEMTREATTIRPHRYDNLHSWYPLWPGFHTVDYGPNNYAWTTAGTLTDEDSPPIPWGARSPTVLRPVVDVLTGTLASTLGALTCSATATTAADGTLVATLGALTVSSAGTVENHGALAQTLTALTLVAAGDAMARADLNVTLASLMLAATGTVANGPAGDLAATLTAMTVAATGTVETHGVGVVTFASLTLAAAGTVETHGAVAVTLAAMTVTAAGAVLISATVVVTLAALTSAIEGDVIDTGVPGTVGGARGSGVAGGSGGTSIISGTKTTSEVQGGH